MQIPCLFNLGEFAGFCPNLVKKCRKMDILFQK